MKREAFWVGFLEESLFHGFIKQCVLSSTFQYTNMLPPEIHPSFLEITIKWEDFLVSYVSLRECNLNSCDMKHEAYWLVF